MAVVFDSEGNGLVREMTKFWCIVTCDEDTKGFKTFYDAPKFEWDEYYSGTVKDGVDFLLSSEETVAHNLIGYDKPAIEKVFGVKWDKPYKDTLVLSRLSNPDRPGGHSIKNWAKFFGGEQKVEHEDWTQFSENMLQRCISDVRLGLKVYKYLKKEMGLE